MNTGNQTYQQTPSTPNADRLIDAANTGVERVSDSLLDDNGESVSESLLKDKFDDGERSSLALGGTMIGGWAGFIGAGAFAASLGAFTAGPPILFTIAAASIGGISGIFALQVPLSQLYDLFAETDEDFFYGPAQELIKLEYEYALSEIADHNGISTRALTDKIIDYPDKHSELITNIGERVEERLRETLGEQVMDYIWTKLDDDERSALKDDIIARKAELSAALRENDTDVAPLSEKPNEEPMKPLNEEPAQKPNEEPAQLPAMPGGSELIWTSTTPGL